MPGEVDPLYVAARAVLLDALDALREHQGSLVLVGAQAIYVHAGEADLAVAPYTTDGDVVIDPRSLAPDPKLAAAMARAGFTPSNQPGTWIGSDDIKIDLLVPEALGGAGKRGARLGVHGNSVARKARGLEAALVDKDHRRIAALDETDTRACEIAVAGPSALLVAKIQKISERTANPGRLKDKDALDVLRILRAIDCGELAKRFAMLKRDAVSDQVTGHAIVKLRELFGTSGAVGSVMAARATAGLESAETISESCAALAQDLLREIE